MKCFIEKKSNLTETEINELLYYYQQGIDIGKEEAIICIINNLIKLNLDYDIISKAVNIEQFKIEQLLN